MDFSLSDHADARAAHRNLSEEDINDIILYGHLERRAGARIYQLRAKDIPPDTPAGSRLWRLIGTTVLISKSGGCIITFYRDARAFRRDRRKTKFYQQQAAV